MSSAAVAVWPEVPPKLPPSLHSLSLQSALLLTGQVTKTEPYYFDHGGSADIWKGRWANKDSGYAKEVRINLRRWPFLWILVFQVAVKVLKGLHWQDPSKHIVWFRLHCRDHSLIYILFDQKLLRELRVWSAVHHENIVPFLGITFDFDRPCTPCLVSPYYRNGNVISYLKKQPAVDKIDLVSHMLKLNESIHAQYYLSLHKLRRVSHIYTAYALCTLI